MRRPLAALCLLAASASVAQTPDRPGRDVDGDAGPFVAEIEYGEPSGALRHAALTLTPTAADGTPPWNGEVASVVVVSDKGTWHVVDRLLSSGHQTGVVRADALLPAIRGGGGGSGTQRATRTRRSATSTSAGGPSGAAPAHPTTASLTWRTPATESG